MKTLVRIQHSSVEMFSFMNIQILDKPYKDSDTIEVIGRITFQQSKDKDSWYGLSFVVDTDKYTHLTKMAKLAKFIHNTTHHDTQPDEILKTIGAVEYKIFEHEFVLVSKKGENLYEVFSPTGSLYSRIVAKDEEEARRIMKRRNLENYDLKFKAVVKF